VYFSDTATGLTRPAQELVGFARVELDVEASTEVVLTVPMSQLGYIGLDGRWVIEPGPIEVLVGASSDDIRLRGVFEVTGAARDLTGRRSFLSRAEVRRPSPGADRAEDSEIAQGID
jgi:beta-glucosidase